MKWWSSNQEKGEFVNKGRRRESSTAFRVAGIASVDQEEGSLD